MTTTIESRALGAILIGVGWVFWDGPGGGAVNEALVMTMVFTALAFAQLARALASRSFTGGMHRTGLRGNPVLMAMLAAALVLQLAVVYLPAAQEFFGTTSLDAWQLAICAGVATVVLAAMEVDKLRRRRAHASGGRTAMKALTAGA